MSFTDKTLKYLTLGILFLFFAVLFIRPLELDDIWWHLEVGKWVFHNFHVPTTDIFSLPENSVPWTFTQWLGSCIYYGVFKMGGVFGLKLFRVIFFILTCGIFLRYGSKRVPFPLLILVTLLLALCLAKRCLLRPFIFNFIFVQIFLIVLYTYWSEGTNRLYILPLLSIFWINIHIGSLIYGSSIIIIFLLAALVDYINLKLLKESEYNPNILIKRIRDISLLLAAFLASFIFTPYGLAGILYPFKVILLPDFIDFYWLNNIITELRPPLNAFTLQNLWFPILTSIALSLFFTGPKNKFLNTLLLASGIAIYLHGMRGGPFFGLVASYTIAFNCQESKIKEKWDSFGKRKIIENLAYILMIIFMGLIVIRNCNRTIYKNNKFVKFLYLDYNEYTPQRTIQVLNNNNINGVIFNSLRSGGYIIWSSFPELMPFTDGRQANMDQFNRYIEILHNPDKLWSWAVKKYNITIALLDSANSTYGKLIKYLNADKDWQLVIIEGSHVTYVRKGVYKLPPSLYSLEFELEKEILSSSDIYRLKDMLKKREGSKNNNYFVPSTEYIDVFQEGVTLFDLGYKDAGLMRLFNAFMISDQTCTRKAVGLGLALFNKQQNSE